MLRKKYIEIVIENKEQKSEEYHNKKTRKRRMSPNIYEPIIW